MQCYSPKLKTVLALCVVLCWQGSQARSQTRSVWIGDWEVALATPGGELPFRLEVREDGEELVAVLVNGPERIPVEMREEQDRLTLEMQHYASSLELKMNRNAVTAHGTWRKQRGPDEQATVDCSARPSKLKDLDDPRAFLGRWSVRFSDSQDLAIGVFQAETNKQQVQGTFLTTTGDYRYLVGGVSGETLRLSCFDGAHAFLFQAELNDDGTLDGTFWSGNWYNTTWTANRDDQARLPDGFEQTVLQESVDLADLSFPDSEGPDREIVKRSIGELTSGSQLTLIEVFGTWCPNCHDEAAYLKELRQRYGQRGLHVLGLAFELSDDFEMDRRQVQRYRDRFDVDYPILIAGVADKAAASKSFPVLDRIRSYPTTLFVDANGEVRAIYTGFSGPATGQEHQRLRQRFEALIEKLLSE